MIIDDIVNCFIVDERFTTAGQPSEAELEVVREAGFNVVINLGLYDPKYCLEDEEATVVSLGMRYHHIPVQFDSPLDKEIDTFFEVMDRYPDSIIFIHCARNYRASCFFSLYAQARLQWSRDDADDYIRSIWEPDEVWTAFLNSSRVRMGLSDGRDAMVALGN